ncbi:probable disease resistance protein At4g27220 [Rosa chinensis]|uniref:probable disease resistance protein At4g27220 n=1 Tax=Rosa chinensis TaxID=74649 RepID=UPI001AD902A2|nr:probable disease resistance protein At4g27220 [Rosa chinensis]
MRGCPDEFWPFASDICSQEQVQFNSIQHYSALQTRLWGDIQIVSGDEEWKYDVFLSFRGRDTRRITDQLYDRLQRRGIKMFKDNENLLVGTDISRTLTEAIEESRFAIVVLSQNYASSTWCLEELRTICECMKDQKRILPLFYYVDPTDVRYQKTSFGDAFTKHSRQHKSETILRWRNALIKVASFSGWNSMNFKTENELVDSIVEFLYNKVLPDATEFTFEVFEATRKAMDEVMKAAKDDEVITVGVFGMGGVGKTTMVKHIAMQAFEKGIFDHVIMAVVSERPDFERIQQTLADQLGVKLELETEIGRAARLRKEIMRRNKILIILNDIRERMNLSSLGIPSPNELRMCNSKVLLTTRRLNVCDDMECQPKISLNVLSEQDSWYLFVRNARRSFESVNLEDVARRVARECCGLPIALIAVARALGDKDLLEWKKAAQALKNSQFANSDDHGEASKCIKLSYDYLKDEDSKLCFLFCALFPEYHDIQIEDLFKHAYGKGLFRNAETIEEARGRADSVVRYLKDSSLLLDSEEDGCVRMHPVVRDTALRIASSEDRHGFLVKADFSLQSH